MSVVFDALTIPSPGDAGPGPTRAGPPGRLARSVPREVAPLETLAGFATAAAVEVEVVPPETCTGIAAAAAEDRICNHDACSGSPET